MSTYTLPPQKQLLEGRDLLYTLLSQDLDIYGMNGCHTSLHQYMWPFKTAASSLPLLLVSGPFSSKPQHPGLFPRLTGLPARMKWTFWTWCCDPTAPGSSPLTYKGCPDSACGYLPSLGSGHQGAWLLHKTMTSQALSAAKGLFFLLSYDIW